MKSASLAAWLMLALTVPGCESIQRTRPAQGEVTSLIVVAVDSLWAEVGAEVEAALEPRIFTVRDEKAFEVTDVSPLEETWLELRVFRQVLLVGTPDDGWIRPVLEGDAAAPPSQLPRLVERKDIWARGQVVTAIVLPPVGSAEALRSVLVDLGQRLDQRFREYVLSRMFLSEANTELRDSLAARAGFSLLLPRIYRPEQIQVEGANDVFVFRNATEVGGQLSRAIIVTWRSGMAPADPSGLLAWRQTLVPHVHSIEQVTGSDRLEARPLDRPDGGIEAHTIWSSADSTFPAAGPLILRAIPCPAQDRTYFVEAWLYAPGRSKYEYMIQYQQLLDSFACGNS
ncbi:MAG: DUF4837 family protein [Gemmatimonadetes bacterium]|nr:DUF4837 family protein [Gemmatimonadota bacterium]